MNLAPRVYVDRAKHTCIEVSRDKGIVYYIPLGAGDGLALEKCSLAKFDDLYKPATNYPVEKAARLYAEFAQNLGASKEAMKILAEICPTIINKEIEMATAKQASTVAKKAAAAVVAKANAKNPKEVKKPEVKKKVEPKAVASTKKPDPKTVKIPERRESTERRETAAHMFQDLIMEGKLTDNQIFAKVQDKFDLSDDKRTYVRWYRNKLAKSGKNPPKAK